MSTNKPLAVLGAVRSIGWTHTQVYEALYFTKTQLVVARQETVEARIYRSLEAATAEELLAADKNNFAITAGEVERVELKKVLGAVQIKLVTVTKEKYVWSMRVMPHNDAYTLDDVKRVLMPVYEWKLEVPGEEF
jgi:hypothetical protein